MDEQEFKKLRKDLNKSQREMASLLGVSLKSVQSFEQGWRNVPSYVERQIYFLFAMKTEAQGRRKRTCWIIQNCPEERRNNCPAFEFQCGHLCWFITGTMCRGEVQGNWEKKMLLCRKCKVFRAILPPHWRISFENRFRDLRINHKKAGKKRPFYFLAVLLPQHRSVFVPS